MTEDRTWRTPGPKADVIAFRPGHYSDKEEHMAGSDIEKAFLEAAEIAKKLPKNLQEAGFNRAIEQLLGTTVAPNKGPDRKSVVKGKRGAVRVDLGGRRNMKRKKKNEKKK